MLGLTLFVSACVHTYSFLDFWLVENRNVLSSRRSLRWMSSTKATYLLRQKNRTNIMKDWAELCHIITPLLNLIPYFYLFLHRQCLKKRLFKTENFVNKIVLGAQKPLALYIPRHFLSKSKSSYTHYSQYQSINEDLNCCMIPMKCAIINRVCIWHSNN